MNKKYFKKLLMLIMLGFVLILFGCNNESFTIKFISNDGTEISPITYIKNEDLQMPKPPEKTGHTFIGWFLDSQLNSIFDENNFTISDNIILYAKWQKNNYTIKFYDGEQLLETLIVKYNELPKPTEPIKTGYIFKGWEQNLEVATKDESYNALFELEPIYYNLILNIDGIETTTKYEANDDLNLKEPVKENYIFVGWYLDNSFNNKNTYVKMPETNLKLYAKFKLAPGYKGSIASLNNTKVENQFPGLIIYKIDYNRYHYSNSTYLNIELNFPTPDIVDADYYTLEYFNESTNKFEHFIYNEKIVTADYNNLVLTLNDDYTFRLHAKSKDNKDYYSNTVTTTTSLIETHFSGYLLEQNMMISGIMSPYVGFGIAISVTIHDISEAENILVEEGYTYNWYRLNPYTFEMLELEDQSNNNYITTEEDVGYYILVKILGDEIKVGGYLQVISMTTVKQKIEVINFEQNNDGFILEFDYSFDIFDELDIVIYDEEYNVLEVEDIISLDSNAVYKFKLDLDNVNKVIINLQGNSFILVSFDEDEHTMYGFEINLK